MRKNQLSMSVLDAARERIKFVFDHFETIYVSFSGGKDSSAMLHLVMEEALIRKRKVGVLFIDWEAQYRHTIEFVQQCVDMYADHIDLYWIALPLRTVNAVSMHEPEWTCWEPGKQWVREMPAQAISDIDYFPFYVYGMTFEEFVPLFAHWYGGGDQTACFVGIRAQESLNRFRTLINEAKTTFSDARWTTGLGGNVYNAYPIYDWQTEDIWTYHGKFDKPYNKIYDLMHKAGLSLHQMRICEPYGDEQRRGLWLFHVLEPETWALVSARVAGANSGALYSREAGNIQGSIRITKPDHLTWRQYAEFLLRSMPEKTAEHYRNKIAVWMRWYDTRGKPIQDCIDGDLGSKDKPSWRRVCKMLLKNDYWAKTLCFSPTKTASYEKYNNLMKRRREQWNLI